MRVYKDAKYYLYAEIDGDRIRQREFREKMGFMTINVSEPYSLVEIDQIMTIVNQDIKFTIKRAK